MIIHITADGFEAAVGWTARISVLNVLRSMIR